MVRIEPSVSPDTWEGETLTQVTYCCSRQKNHSATLHPARKMRPACAEVRSLLGRSRSARPSSARGPGTWAGRGRERCGRASCLHRRPRGYCLRRLCHRRNGLGQSHPRGFESTLELCPTECSVSNISGRCEFSEKLTSISNSVANNRLNRSLVTLILADSGKSGVEAFSSPVLRSKKGNRDAIPSSTAFRSTYASGRRATSSSGSRAWRAGKDQCSVKPQPRPRVVRSVSRSKMRNGILSGPPSLRRCWAKSRPEIPAPMMRIGFWVAGGDIG
mgnify:CR=1 FL=1